MGIMSGMENFTGSVEIERYYTTPNDFVKCFSKDEKRVRTGGGENGSITIWRDDDGLYRGERGVFCSCASSFLGKTLKELKEWLKIEIPLTE